MFQTKVVETIKHNFMFKNIAPEKRAVCETMRKITVELDRSQIAI